jgi:hypothetical protein
MTVIWTLVPLSRTLYVKFARNEDGFQTWTKSPVALSRCGMPEHACSVYKEGLC